MASVERRGRRWWVWRQWWVLWHLDVPKWRRQAAERVFWSAWRVRRWKRKLAPQIAAQRAREADLATEGPARVVPTPIWSIKESYYPSRARAAWRWTLYRTPLNPVLARLRFWYHRLNGTAKADGRNYVGWTVRVNQDLTHHTGTAAGAKGRIIHARHQLLHGEYEHDIEFPGGRVACVPLPYPGIELIAP